MMENLEQTRKSHAESVQQYCNRYSLPPEELRKRWPFEYVGRLLPLAEKKALEAAPHLGEAQNKVWNYKRDEDERGRLGKSKKDRERDTFLFSAKGYYRREFWQAAHAMSGKCEAVLMYCSICSDIMRVAHQE
jgi:hypothetical protein